MYVYITPRIDSALDSNMAQPFEILNTGVYVNSEQQAGTIYKPVNDG